MKKCFFFFCASILLFSCKENKESQGETKIAAAATATPSTPQEQQPDSLTMAKNWESYMTPSEVHKMIASWNGSWTGEITMWMSPGAPPTKSIGTNTNKMVLGGRYQQATYKGNFNGAPFEGMSTLAYDNAKKTFISTWIDNMGTRMMVMEGTWDASIKTITFTGKMVEPGLGKEVTVKETYKIIDDNFHFMEMFMTGADGKEFKTMEIKYTRKR